MANFNLENYETVEQRHARALDKYPDLRCVIINHTTENDRAQSMWVVEARVYENAADQAADLPKATEWAFEIDGGTGPNRTSALENANTSALGRALRWAFAGSKGPSREEMSKVARAKVITEPASLTEDIANCKTVEELQSIYELGLSVGWMNDSVRARLAARKAELSA